MPRLYRVAKSGGRYERSLRFLEHAKEIAAESGEEIVTKTGIIVGMGEEMHELLAVIETEAMCQLPDSLHTTKVARRTVHKR